MFFKKLSEKKWFNGAIIACIGVAFYVFLTNLKPVLSAAGIFLGYFKAVFLGAVFAYVINPLAKIFYYRLFKMMKVGKTRWTLSVTLAFLTGLLVLVFLGGILFPQLVHSIKVFSEKYEGYAAALIELIEGSPLEVLINPEQLHTLSKNALSSIQSFVLKNAGSMLSSVANSGKQIASTVISLILAVYLLLDKVRVIKGLRRFVRSLIRSETSETMLDFLLRCDSILMSFLGQSLLDSTIVGSATAIFMLICRMQYIGLVSLVVAVTNLVPNFGPAIGMAIASFILLLVNPKHVLLFLIFAVILQVIDAYILKPKLFANSLGVSGLLILVASIVFGNMFGILGVLLAIPAAAILSFIYHDYFLPKHELNREQE